MSFCKLSSEFVINSSTNIDNVFINEYLPSAPDSCVKVFLYGLYKCGHATSGDNSIESFAKVLNLSAEDIESAFLYWQEQGLVQIISTDPIEVRYLPIKASLNKVKKFDEAKYASFNLELQEIIENRMITPTEYQEYYSLMEIFKLEPTALIMIIKYATEIKGKNVGYKYITTIAKNWAYEGVKTAAEVEEKLLEFESNSGHILEILKILGVHRPASFEERQMFIKWTKEFDFLLDDILLVAKTLNKKGGMSALDAKLAKYYELKLLSYTEIKSYESEKDNMYSLAKDITKNIGVYYENLTQIVETYIADWLKKGYSNETLLNIAEYCFKHSIRTLEGMNNVVLKFYKLGLVNLESIEQYIAELIDTDNQIKQVLNACGLLRNVNSWDRDYYKTWTANWNFNLDIVMYACELAVGKSNPVQYVNKILSSWHEKGITTLEKAKEESVSLTATTIATTKKMRSRNYSNEELNALFDNLDEVDI
ncbi:MAG: DnaD domain protein [Spirochaetales bacterium]